MKKKKKGLILIVDDLPENVLVVEKTLQKEGYQTEIATSGNEAIERIANIKPDLILLDVLMPNMNGFKVCEIIKSNPENKTIPIIFLTALHEPHYIVEGLKVGGVDFISKPFNLTELLARVQTHIKLKKALEDNDAYISKLKKTNDELQKTKIILSELNNSKDKFFSIVAHDLRNPFQGFSKLTDYIMNHYDSLDREELKEMISDMNISALKLNKLLENLLAWAKIQLGKFSIKLTEHNLKQLVDINIILFQDSAKAKNIELINSIPEDFVIYTDLQMINVIIRNLLSNALKFTDLFGQVKFRAKQINGHILLTIEDNGIGIASDELSLLFAIDSQLIKTGTAGEFGTGLGLILVKELLDRLGCNIVVKSHLDKGSSFTIKIPSQK